MVARPNGSNWNTVPGPSFEKVSQTDCTTEVPKGKQSEDEEQRWKRKVEVVLFNLKSSCHLPFVHVACSISPIIFPMEQVELLADLLGKHP